MRGCKKSIKKQVLSHNPHISATMGLPDGVLGSLWILGSKYRVGKTVFSIVRYVCSHELMIPKRLAESNNLSHFLLKIDIGSEGSVR